jgi:hypothetical protein
MGIYAAREMGLYRVTAVLEFWCWISEGGERFFCQFVARMGPADVLQFVQTQIISVDGSHLDICVI